MAGTKVGHEWSTRGRLHTAIKPLHSLDLTDTAPFDPFGAHYVTAAGKKVSKGKIPPVIEKTGALVGMRDPFEKDFRYPFHVVAIKQAQMVALSAKDLLEVLHNDHPREFLVLYSHICRPDLHV